jgi:hypothetical protein
MIAPMAAKAVPPKNLRRLASMPPSALAAFFPAMIVLPRRFFVVFCSRGLARLA